MPFDPLLRRSSLGLAFRPELTQGAVLSGLRLSRYSTGTHFGFLITARCDLAHVRTDTVNFLPIISLDEWLSFDGTINILLTRILAIEDKLKDLVGSISPALQEMIGNDWAIGHELFIRNNPDIDQKIKDKFAAHAEEFTILHDILQTNADSPAAIKKAAMGCEAFRNLIKRETPRKIIALLENKILDAHFIPVVHPSENIKEGPGYVILFRQIIALPGNLLEVLTRGVASPDEINSTFRDQARQLFTFPAEIVANIASPHVEHILQRFANVFGRIGVTDCSKRYQEWLVKTKCGEKE